MAVLIRITNRGMSLDNYDRISAQLLPEVKRQAGFHMHVCYAIDDGFIVSEIWDSAEQHRAWHDAYVRPKLPPDAKPNVEVIELHNVVTK